MLVKYNCDESQTIVYRVLALALLKMKMDLLIFPHVTYLEPHWADIYIYMYIYETDGSDWALQHVATFGHVLIIYIYHINS